MGGYGRRTESYFRPRIQYASYHVVDIWGNRRRHWPRRDSGLGRWFGTASCLRFAPPAGFARAARGIVVAGVPGGKLLGIFEEHPEEHIEAVDMPYGPGPCWVAWVGVGHRRIVVWEMRAG